MTTSGVGGVLLLPNAWTPEFCLEVRHAMDDGEPEPAEIVEGAITLDDTVRRAFDVTIDPRVLTRLEAALAHARPRIADFFRVALTGSVGATCLRYVEGGHYLRHRDRDPQPGSGTEDRRISVIVWLNSATSDIAAGEFQGGTLNLFTPDARQPTAIIPVAGTLVAFPSEWPHEVLPVTRGTRDVVVDWFL